MKFLCVIFLTLSFSLLCLSQTNNKQENFRLIQTKPSAYITFEKFATREPRIIGESKEKILLRFHNNTKWNLNVSTISCRTIEIEDECIVFYKIDQLPESKISNNKSDFPKVNRKKHVSYATTLKSGESLLFEVPKEDLAEGLYILLEFNYEWEAGGNGGDGSGFIFHQVPFISTDLPKSKKN